jgi:hypothetical protein
MMARDMKRKPVKGTSAGHGASQADAENPVAKQGQGEDIFDYMVGRAKEVGDIVGPVTPLEDWETT